MLNFWEEAKGQISSYNMQDKAFMIFWFMIYTFGVAYGIINALTSIYIYEWGMQISFLKYKKKIEWEEFSVIRRYHNHFFFNGSPSIRSVTRSTSGTCTKVRTSPARTKTSCGRASSPYSPLKFSVRSPFSSVYVLMEIPLERSAWFPSLAGSPATRQPVP